MDSTKEKNNMEFESGIFVEYFILKKYYAEFKTSLPKKEWILVSKLMQKY